MASIETRPTQSRDAGLAWRNVPWRHSRELVRLFGEELRASKQALGRAGVHRGRQDRQQEGLGEVQEMIDICDFAPSVCRASCGLTIASERPGAPHDGNLASAGVVGGSAPSTSGGRVGVERRAGAGLRQPACLWKPSRKRRSDRAGHAGCSSVPWALCRARVWRRMASPPCCSGARTLAHAGGRQPRVALVVGHRLHAHGPRRGPDAAQRFARSILNWAATTRHHRAQATLEMAERAVTFAAGGHRRASAARRCAACSACARP